MGASRGEIGKPSAAGDGGNGGTGGVVCAIRLDGDEASVFCKKTVYVEGYEIMQLRTERSRVGFNILPKNALVFCRTEDFGFYLLSAPPRLE
jgi:hypothetical protein